VLPWRRRTWDTLPAEGVHEIFETFTTAIAAARSYLYLEDQYLAEYLGGQRHYELYPHLRAAARRGVKVVLVGSGVRDPEDPGIYLRPINRSLNRDLRRKLVKPLADGALDCVTVWRVQDCTVHSKVLLVDDTFACIGSANMFSRSMHGDDSEVSAAVSTTTTLVRDLRVQLWGEHLRIPVDGDVRADLENVDVALGLWSPRWLPGSVAPDIWSARTHTSALRPVWPKRA
jgi:phosphatidylserine/phosphatidylglycerophosphate/cardiolipin synthase-like enzyme